MLEFAAVFAVVQVSAYVIGHNKGKRDGLFFSANAFRQSANIKFQKHMQELRAQQ